MCYICKDIFFSFLWGQYYFLIKYGQPTKTFSQFTHHLHVLEHHGKIHNLNKLLMLKMQIHFFY